MKKDKILLCIEKLEDIEKYEKLGISNFLFPLKDFSVGYDSFSFEEIASLEVNAYILANRLLTDDDIDAFLSLNIPSNVLGFIVEDTGLYVAIKDKGYTLINFQNHLNANYKTCNYWLRRFDSLVLSTDITLEEIRTILKECNKPLVIHAFGYPMIMYSRRALVSNYYDNFKKSGKKEVTLKDPKGDFDFRLKETDYGTSCFDSHILDTRSILDDLPDEKILFYLIYSNDIDASLVKKAISGKEIEGTTRGFLDKKTVYRIGDLK